MTPSTPRITLLLALAVSLAAAGAMAHEPTTASPKAPAHKSTMAGHNPASMELHRIMSRGQKMPMPMSGNVNKDFATMMTMHHRQAIEMSDVLLKSNANAELKALATKMKVAQQAEIKIMAPYTK